MEVLSPRQSLVRAAKAAQELTRRNARRSFKHFVRYIQPDYDMQWFHAYICERLQAFAEKKIKNLMILMGPQHGKSELASRKFPAFLLGNYPDVKIALTSYSDNMATGLNRAVQINIDSARYADVFPDTKLNWSKLFRTNYSNVQRNEHIFQVVGRNGSLRAVGRGGSLTGATVDVGIIDDLYKDRVEAMSQTVSMNAWQWYVDVFKTRLHNDSQQLIMNTLWSENDVAMRLMKDQRDQWEVIRLPAIRTADVAEFDPRKLGEALWEKKHSYAKIMEQKALDEVSFNSLYQQDPKPNTKLLICGDWIEIPSWPVVTGISGAMVPLETKCWGLDFGKTTGINALVKYAMNGRDVYFEEGCYEPGISCETIKMILDANGYQPGEIVFCDHLPAKIAELVRLGVNAIMATKGQGSVAFGLDKFKEVTVHYTSRSVNLKMETRKYQWTAYGSLITNIPVDEFNHAIDACRYAFVSSFFRLPA